MTPLFCYLKIPLQNTEKNANISGSVKYLFAYNLL
jgi:hypothetical protein